MLKTKHRSDMWLPFATDFNNRRVCMVVWFNNSRALPTCFFSPVCREYCFVLLGNSIFDD
jgi:hypothetical protein